MRIGHIIAIIIIYLVSCGGWALLGTSTAVRSDLFADRLSGAVRDLWGGELVQDAPRIRDVTTGSDLLLEASHIVVDLDLEHRRKGLVWYPTYTCRFDGGFTLRSSTGGEQAMRVLFRLPDSEATYHDVAVEVNGVAVQLEGDPRKGIGMDLVVPANQDVVLRVAYKTRGLRSWHYRPAVHAGRVCGLDLTADIDFTDYDFPDGAIAADRVEDLEDGLRLQWSTPEMITSGAIGIVAPDKLNPGPLSARMTFFAPVCLGFFFLILATVTVVRQTRIHPMHYLFVAGGFVAFHLLFAYLVDLVPVHPAFLVAAATSVGLVVTYLRAAIGPGLPIAWIAGGQICFLVLFSYSFFLDGATGLTVAAGSVVFLGFLMRVTAHVDWTAFFARDRDRTAAGMLEAEV